MYKKNLIIAGSIALSLHATLIMMSPNVTSEPEVIFQKGDSSLKMNLVPSSASTKSNNNVQEEASKEEHQAEKKMINNPGVFKKAEERQSASYAFTNPIIDIHENIYKVEDKIIENAALAKKKEPSGEKQVKVEEKAEHFKARKEVNKKQSQIQENNIATQDSKEIIADVKVKGVTMGAMVTNVFKPSYPSSCKRQGHEGITVLEVTILSKGECGSIGIIKSAGCESLNKAAIEALKRAKYVPAKRFGVPFTSTKKIAFNFKLEDYQ